jgi:hypothetical protein
MNNTYIHYKLHCFICVKLQDMPTFQIRTCTIKFSDLIYCVRTHTPANYWSLNSLLYHDRTTIAYLFINSLFNEAFSVSQTI